MKSNYRLLKNRNEMIATNMLNKEQMANIFNSAVLEIWDLMDYIYCFQFLKS